MNESDKADVINICWRVIEEMKQGSYADPDGKRAHFFSLPESEQYEALSEMYHLQRFEPKTKEELQRVLAVDIILEAVDLCFGEAQESA